MIPYALFPLLLKTVYIKKELHKSVMIVSNVDKFSPADLTNFINISNAESYVWFSN